MQIKKGYENISSDRTKYYLNGISYPRVSTILKNIHKKPLIAWAVKVGCDKIYELLDEHLKLVNNNFKYLGDNELDFIEQGRNEHIRLFTEAQEYGSFVHDKIECWLKKCEEPKRSYPADWKEPAEKSLQSFIDYWQDNKFELIKSEMAVINKRLKYGGRIDILARKGGEIVILDIKTSKSIWNSAKIQCGLYALALEDMCLQIEKNVSKSIILHIPKLNPKVKAIVLEGKEFEYAKKAGLDLVSLYYNLKGIK